MAKLNILTVYANNYYFPLRPTLGEHLYAFRRNSAHRCAYLNVAAAGLPKWAERIEWDLIVFHAFFFHCEPFMQLDKFIDAVRALKNSPARKIIIIQDEYSRTKQLCDFINEFDVNAVFSVASPSEWPKIYAGIDTRKVRFYEVLTGYIDRRMRADVEKIARSGPKRDIDIGYRAKAGFPWLGRHGMLKGQIAQWFQEWADKAGNYKTDISTMGEDTFYGLDWFRFLLRCRFTIGVESGASLLDQDGSVYERTSRYAALYPAAGFEQIEKACFAGLDGNLKLFTLSPRHLEAVLTRTGQILLEGRYNGVLQAGRHYIELKKDLSNRAQVMALLGDEALRQKQTEQAYRDIVLSGKYDYRVYVKDVIAKSMQGKEQKPKGINLIQSFWFALAAAYEMFAWGKVALNKFRRRGLKALNIETLVCERWRALGRQDVYLYGAGKHTAWLLNVVARVKDGPHIVAILDDQTERSSMGQIKILSPQAADWSKVRTVVLSTDVFQKQMRESLSVYGTIKSVDLYEGLPAGPYPKRGISA